MITASQVAHTRMDWAMKSQQANIVYRAVFMTVYYEIINSRCGGWKCRDECIVQREVREMGE